MNWIYIAVVLALLAALLHWFIGGIPSPWEKVILAGIIVIFVVGILALLGVLPNFGGLNLYPR